MNAPAQGLSLVSIIALIRKEIERSGTEGPKGEDGKQGAKGERGAKGDTGPAGKQGPKGKDGKQGKSGKDGSDGKDGDDGVGIKDISQDIDGVVIVTMTDGETYEIELPLGANTEVHYKTSGGGGSSGTVDLAPYVLRPTTRMSGWLAYREDGNKGEWTPVTTDLVTVNPNQFRDINGRFAPTPKELDGINNQRDVNEFLYGKIQEVGGEHEDFATQESLAKEAEMRREKDEFLQDQINNNQSQIDNIQEKGYDDTEIREEIADEAVARDEAIAAEKLERSLADIGLRDSLQGRIDSLEAYDDTEIKEGLAAEITAREEGDESLQGQIDAISEKGYDDTEIKEGLAAEISTRESEDKELQKQIEAEKQERSLADIGLRDSLQANIDAIEVPSIEGLATEEYVDSAIEGIEFPETDLTGLATEEYVDGAVSSEADARREADKGLQSEIEDLADVVVNLDIPSIDGLASEEWVTDQIDALEPYDDTGIKQELSDEAVARAEKDADLQDQIDQISEKGYDDTGIKEGLAKESEDRADADAALAKQIEDEKTERSLADIGLRDSLQANIDAIEIPSLDGYATEEYVDGAIDAIEFPETDLSEYAKTEYVDGAVGSEAETRRIADDGLQSEISTLADTVANLKIPDLDGYATEEWVEDQIDAIEFPETDLSEYAKTEYVDGGDANLQSQIDSIEIPSIDGLATEEWVTGEIEAIEFPETDLTAYAKTEYVDAGDSNLQEQIDGIEIPSLDGYATEGWVTDQIDAIPETDLSDYYTKTEVDESQSTQDDRITVNEGGIATNLNSIKVEAEAREQEDNHLQAEIDQIALALEALLVQREAGRWEYIGFSGDNIPRNPGEFSLLSDDLSSSENNITINQTDLGGKFHGFGDVAVGDYVEIVDLDKPDEYALFIVDSEPNGTGIVSMNLKLKDKGNNFLIGTTCEIRFFQLNEQDLDLTELDARYLTKKGGKTDGILILGYDEEVTNNEAAAQIGFVKTHVDEAIQRIPPPDLSAYALTEYVDEADLNLQQQIDGIEIPSLEGYATEEYVDNAVGGIEFPETDLSDYYTKQEVNESQQAQDALISGNTSAIEGEAQARADADAALDAKIDAIEIPSLEGYATEEYVDTAIEGIEFPETDLTEYAKTAYVDGADTLLQEQIDALEAYDDAGIKQELADEVAAREAGDANLQGQIDAIEIPSLDGYATEEWVSGQIEAIPETDLTEYAKTDYVDAGDKGLQDQLDALEIPSLEGYATEGYVDSAIDSIEFPETDLTEYAKTDYVDAADASLQQQIDDIDIPSLEGYATEEYVDTAIDAIEFPETDLSGYYTKGEVDASQLSQDEKITANEEGVTKNKGDILVLDSKIDTNTASIESEVEARKQGDIDSLAAANKYTDEAIEAIPETDLTSYAKTEYVDSADAHLQSQIDAIDIPDFPEVPDLSDYVSKTAGDQTMTGSLTISGLGTWKGSRINLEYVTAPSEASILKLGTPDNEENLRVYKDKVKVTTVPLLLKTIQGFASGHGTYYEGAYSEPNHIATKKDVDAAIGGGGGGDGYDDTQIKADLAQETQGRIDGDKSLQDQIDAIDVPSIDTSGFVKKTGDTMTGTLEATELRAKDVTPGTVAPILVEGWVSGTSEAARITMSNKQYNNAYGNLTWHGNNGNGWFQFNKDVDLSNKNLHSVNHIRLTGDKTIQEAQTDRIKLDGKVIILKAGSSNTAGFTLKGTTNSGNNGDLLRAYHNSSGLDAINYEGRTTAGSTNLATCEYVDNKVSSSGSAGSLISHTERLYSAANGADGRTFYFQNENGVPTTGMNAFRKFKWKLPDWHYLSKMVGAGDNFGFLVVCNTGGSLLYQCPVSKADKSGLHITLDLDHDHHYGTGAIGNESFFVVHMYSCLREG